MPVVTGFSFCISKIVKCECKWGFKSISRSTKPDKECKLKIRIKLEFCMVHFTVKFKQWLDTFTSKMQICSSGILLMCLMNLWVCFFSPFFSLLLNKKLRTTQESGMGLCGNGVVFFSLEEMLHVVLQSSNQSEEDALIHWCKSVPM